MSLPATSPRSFVPSRFLNRQLFAIVVGSSLTIVTFIFWPKLAGWLLSSNFLPHAYCYLRNPGLIWTNVTADALIGISYLAISVTLGYLGYKGRRDIPYHGMFLAFGLFILGCGGTHFVEAITVWIPVYVLSAAVKVFTAVVSLTTAAVLPFTVPHVFDLIRPGEND